MLCKEELFSAMEKIVKRYVKHFQADFEVDKVFIEKVLGPDDAMANERYLYWIVRECGTNIGYKSKAKESDTYAYYLHENRKVKNRFYEIDLEKGTVKYIRDPEKYRRVA